MKNTLRIFLAVVGIAVLAGGCSKGGSFMDRMATLEKQSCACTDKTCADKALNDFIGIGIDMKKENAQFGPEDTKKLSMHTIAILGCVAGKGVSPLTIQQAIQKLK